MPRQVQQSLRVQHAPFVKSNSTMINENVSRAMTLTMGLPYGKECTKEGAFKSVRKTPPSPSLDELSNASNRGRGRPSKNMKSVETMTETNISPQQGIGRPPIVPNTTTITDANPDGAWISNAFSSLEALRHRTSLWRNFWARRQSLRMCENAKECKRAVSEMRKNLARTKCRGSADIHDKKAARKFYSCATNFRRKLVRCSRKSTPVGTIVRQSPLKLLKISNKSWILTLRAILHVRRFSEGYADLRKIHPSLTSPPWLVYYPPGLESPMPQ